MPKVKVIKRYSDVRLKEIVKKGTTMDVDEERAKHLVKEGVAEIIKEPKNLATAGKE